MLEKIKNKWNKQHILSKVFFTIWLGFLTGVSLTGGKQWITDYSNTNIQAIECKYVETIVNIGFPDVQPNLIEFDMQKSIGGKRVLINRFKHTLSQVEIFKYYDEALVKQGWQTLVEAGGQRIYEKDGIVFLIKFLPNNVYEVKLSLTEQK